MGSMDKMIEKKINEPEFLEKLAKEIRFPVLYFNQNGTILRDQGAAEQIKNIKVITDSTDLDNVTEIIIEPTKYMKSVCFSRNKD